MIKIVTADQMRSIEREADGSGLTYSRMMEAAGNRVAEFIARLDLNSGTRQIAFLIGKGNNGGDGLVAARILAASSANQVTCIISENREVDQLSKVAEQSGVSVLHLGSETGIEVLTDALNRADIIVDSILGTGIRLPLSKQIQEMLSLVNRTLSESRSLGTSAIVDPASPAQSTKKRPIIVAVDCPTGLDCTSGQVDTATLRADHTMSLAAVKLGHIKYPGAEYIGEIHIGDIGIPPTLPTLASVTLELLDGGDAANLLPARSRNSHKGNFGTATIVAGSKNYPGAAGLSGIAAYRVGCGLVRMAIPEKVQPMLVASDLEAIWLPLPEDAQLLSDKAIELIASADERTSAYLLGPGLGTSAESAKLVTSILRHLLDRRKSANISPARLVLDADGLNVLSSFEDWPLKLPERTILTPHVGEFGRLTGIDRVSIQENRIELASEKAKEWNAVVVLKGAYTVVASPEGQVSVSPFATDALAKAGSGDVLAGMIVGFLAQGVTEFDASRLATYLHGYAGDLCGRSMGTRSVTASDVIRAIPEALRHLQLERL